MYLSGGLYQEYKTDDVLNPPKKAVPGSALNPNANDLFQIVKIALQKKDMVGCVLENVWKKSIFLNFNNEKYMS